jgi:hypothetical protein
MTLGEAACSRRRGERGVNGAWLAVLKEAAMVSERRRAARVAAVPVGCSAKGQDGYARRGGAAAGAACSFGGEHRCFVPAACSCGAGSGEHKLDAWIGEPRVR